MLHNILGMIITKHTIQEDLSKLTNDAVSMQFSSDDRIDVKIWEILKKARSARKLNLLSDAWQCHAREWNFFWTEEGLVNRILISVDCSSSLLSVFFSFRPLYLMLVLILFYIKVVPVRFHRLIFIFSSIDLPSSWHPQREHLKRMVYCGRFHEHANGSMGPHDGMKSRRAEKWFYPYQRKV